MRIQVRAKGRRDSGLIYLTFTSGINPRSFDPLAVKLSILNNENNEW